MGVSAAAKRALQEGPATATYHLTPKAREGVLRMMFDLEERFSPEVVERAVDKLEAAFEQLAPNTRIGHRHDDLTLDERVLF